MSFSKPKLQNPCSKFIEYKGDTGIFRYWDKELEENVELETPCFLIVLDELSTIKGYNDELKSGITSNEVHSLTNEILRVRSFKGGLSIVGKYSDIKNEIKSEGGKFTKSVYCMAFDDQGKRELINFQFQGAAFSAWLDFKFNPQQHVVCITGENTDEKKGSINYKKPIFKRYNLKDEYVADAITMDNKLQEYFASYKEKQTEEIVEKEEKTSEESFHETNYEQDKNDVYGGNDVVYPDSDTEDDLPF